MGSHNVTGEWHGTYGYPAQAGPATPFIARLADGGGALSGTIVEPDMIFQPGMLTADIRGHRTGNSVDFTKIYRSPAAEYENPVDYVGHLSADGTAIVGVWSMLDWDGTFEMFRDARAEAPQATEAATAAR